jgi:hypothetical protein
MAAIRSMAVTLIDLPATFTTHTARPGELLSLARALDVLGPMRVALDLGSAE